MEDRQDTPGTLAPHPDTIDGAAAAYGAGARVLIFDTFEAAARYADRTGLGLRTIQNAGEAFAITLPAGSFEAAVHDLLDAEGYSAV